MEIKRLIGGFFWTILFMLGNHLIEFFPPQLHRLLNNNIFVEHIVLFFIIYFVMELGEDTGNVSPFEKFYESAIIYAFYLFFSKSTLIYSIIVILLLAANYIIISQQKYLRRKNKNGDHLDQSIEIISWVILGIMVVSFFVYLDKQIKDNKNFSIKRFVFGNKKNRISRINSQISAPLN